MKTYKNINDLIGNTPLLELENIKKELNLFGNVFIKLEYFNPAGSVKDRAAKYMIDEAEKSGIIKSGCTIIEPTSGNTGIGLSAIGTSRGYKVILTMPDTMSVERIKLLKAYGAEVVLTEGKLGMKGAIDKAIQLHKEIKNSFIPSQFDNPANVKAHYETTGVEIYNDLEGKVDVFVAGVGSGGTVSGTGRYLKEVIPEIKIIAVEPFSSPLISKGVFGPHKIQGIGANFIPKNYDSSVVDEVFAVKNEDAYNSVKLIAKKQGILLGISSGAALYCAIELAKKKEYKDKNIVAIMPDGGDRYLSTDLFL